MRPRDLLTYIWIFLSFGIGLIITILAGQSVKEFIPDPMALGGINVTIGIIMGTFMANSAIWQMEQIDRRHKREHEEKTIALWQSHLEDRLAQDNAIRKANDEKASQ